VANRESPQKDTQKKLLIIGPLPPPIGGGTINVQILLDELKKYCYIDPITVNISPKNYRNNKLLFSYDVLCRGFFVIAKFIEYRHICDAVLLIATSRFIVTIGFGLLMCAKIFNIPMFIKPLGGDIGIYVNNQSKMICKLRRKALESINGIFVQTQQLQKEFTELNFLNVSYIPGYRQKFDKVASCENQDDLRLIFLSQIYREKGPFLLFDALQELEKECGTRISCDFYGPIYEKDRQKFFHFLTNTPGTKYCGTLAAGSAIPIMSCYDVFVFPTYRFHDDGHPGVIIEALMAGLPVISTKYQSVSELVVNGVNGIVVPIGDKHALVEAVKQLAQNQEIRHKMSLESLKRGQEFKASVVIPKMMKTIFPDLDFAVN
jgi:glycosyltransferase involved in cell wall biosynthesis